MSSERIIDEIRERLDIVDVIKGYVPSLKKAGRSYKACCPFHNERTPSFTVSQDKQRFYCFGCQTHGDIFTFVMKMDGLSFSEAAQKLAEKAGLEWRPSAEMGHEERLRLEMRKALSFAADFYHNALLSLPAAETARKYLAHRHIGQDTLVRFRLGYAPGNFDSFYKAALKAGFKEDLLIKAGLAARGERGLRDYFFSRLMFPIENHRGEVVGFGGRVLDDKEPKYLNSPETPVFSKGQVLYGLAAASKSVRDRGRILLTEGYMDVIGCHQAGADYAVAPLGTAFGEYHARLIKRYCQEAVLMFDPDAAGKKAALKSAAVLIENGLFPRMAVLKDGLDPDEFIIKYGREEFEKVVAGASDVIDFHAALILADMKKPLSAQDKARAATMLSQTIALQQDAIVKAEWIKYAAQKLDVREEVFRARLSVGPQHGAPQPAQVKEPAAKNAEYPPFERDLIKWLLKFPALAPLAAGLEAHDFSDERAWSVLQALRAAVEQGVQEQGMVTALAERLPQEGAALSRMAVEELPKGSEPDRDINGFVSGIRKAQLKKRFDQLGRQIKQVSASGRDVTALLAEQAEIGRSLKSSNLKE